MEKKIKMQTPNRDLINLAKKLISETPRLREEPQVNFSQDWNLTDHFGSAKDYDLWDSIIKGISVRI